MKLLHSHNGIHTQHHFLLSKAIFEKLLKRNSWLNAQIVVADEKRPLCEALVIHMDGVWIYFLAVEVVLDSIGAVEEGEVENFHEDGGVAVKGSIYSN